MSQKQKVLLLGATGLIGKYCLDFLCAEKKIGDITVFSRRPVDINDNRKVTEVIVDFDTIKDHTASLKINSVICCLGTTIAKAGSKAAFRKVDFTYPLQIATLAKEAGASRFLIVTAVGANPKSKIFYNRTKGEIEEALKMLEYDVLGIYRPSLLLGERAEKRPFEHISQKATTALSFLIPARYKPIQAQTVAASLVSGVLTLPPGTHVFESEEIAELPRKYKQGE